MRSSLKEKVMLLNETLGNPLLPWSPEKGVQEGCLVLDYYQPGDSKAPYKLEKTLAKGGFLGMSHRMSAKEMEAFLDGALFVAQLKKA